LNVDQHFAKFWVSVNFLVFIDSQCTNRAAKIQEHANILSHFSRR